ncbi:MAG: hypothetical protein WA364_12565 [Candidatus Nitrosopolaris sp.]
MHYKYNYNIVVKVLIPERGVLLLVYISPRRVVIILRDVGEQSDSI